MKNNDLLKFMGIDDQKIEKAKKEVKQQNKQSKKNAISINVTTENKKVDREEITEEFMIELAKKAKKPQKEYVSFQLEVETKKVIEQLVNDTGVKTVDLYNALLKKH